MPQLTHCYHCNSFITPCTLVLKGMTVYLCEVAADRLFQLLNNNEIWESVNND